MALSVAGHLAILLALVFAHTEPPKAPDPGPASATLIDVRPLAVAAPAPAPARPASATPARRRRVARPAAHAPDASLLAVKAPKADPDADSAPGLTDAQLAGAATADSGATGGACNMARRVQTALRKDPLVQAAVTQAAVTQAAASAGRAILVWNGDWVRSQAEDGKGLAAVREAIMWEIAFAPTACRAEPVHGLVLISLNAAPGSTRLAVGAGDWRWSDLLTPHPSVPDDASPR